jgi:hypothetical protein
MFIYLEANVRYFCRAFPSIHATENRDILITEDSRRYKILDFLAGTLNYGHSHHAIKSVMLHHLSNEGIVYALDSETPMKLGFLRKFQMQIILPRYLNYSIQLAVPAGVNAIEAALNVAMAAVMCDAISNAFDYTVNTIELNVDVQSSTSRTVNAAADLLAGWETNRLWSFTSSEKQHDSVRLLDGFQYIDNNINTDYFALPVL